MAFYLGFLLLLVGSHRVENVAAGLSVSAVGVMPSFFFFLRFYLFMRETERQGPEIESHIRLPLLCPSPSTHSLSILKTSLSPNQTPNPLAVITTFLLPPDQHPWQQPFIYLVSMDLSTLNISRKWDHTTCDLL